MNTDLIPDDRFHLLEATQTYVVAAFALFIANISTLTAVLGFVLVCIRLTYEIPRAWAVLRVLFRRRKDE